MKLSFLVIALILTCTVWAESLPEHLDYPKQKVAYDTAKQKSDLLRKQADQAKEQLDLASEKIMDVEDQIASNKRTQEFNSKRTTQLQVEIPRLQGENRQLNREIDLIQTEMDTQRDLVSNYNRERANLTKDLRDLEKIQQSHDVELAEIRTKLRREKSELSVREAEYQRSKNELNQTMRNITLTQNRIEETRAGVQSAQRNLAEQEKNLKETTDYISSLETKIQRLNSQLKIEQNMVINLENARQSAQAELQVSQRNLQRVESENKEILEQLNQSKRKKERAEEKLQKSQSHLNTLQSNLSGSRQQLQQAQQASRTLDSDLANAQQSLRNQQNNLQTSQSNLRQLENELSTLERQYPNPRDRNEEVRRKFVDVQRKIERTNRQVENEKKAVEDSRTQVNRIQSRIQQNTQRIESLRTEISNKEREVVSAERSVQEARGQVQSADRELQQAEQKARPVQQKLEQAQREVNRNRQKLDQVQRDIEIQKRKVADIQADIGQSDRSRRQAQEKKRGFENEIRTSKDIISKGPRRIETLRAELQNLNRNKPQLERQVNEADRVLRRQEIIVQDLEAKEIHQNRVISEYQRKIDSLEVEIRTLTSKIQYAQNQVDELVRGIRDLENQIATNNNRVSSYQREIENLLKTNDRLETEILNLQSQLPNLLRGRDQAKIEFDKREKLASDAETVTEDKRRYMAEVKERFDVLSEKARMDGLRQGEAAGYAASSQDGQQDGRLSGQESGEIEGKNQGLIYGYERGREEGVHEGKTKGYEQGLNLPENFEAGRKIGLQQGQKTAEAEAIRVDYPQSRDKKRKELLSVLPRNIITKENETERVNNLSQSSINERIFQFMSHSAGAQLFANIEMASDMSPMASDSSSEKSCKIISESPFQHKVVSPGPVKCDYTYSAINQICEQSYEDAFIEEYRRNYTKVYKESKYEACIIIFEKSFNSHSTVRWKEGYDQTYPVSFREWEQKGAEVAKNKGYKAGEVEGYRSSIDQYRFDERARGESDEAKRFASEAVLQFTKVSYSKISNGPQDKIIAGDDLSLHIQMINFGGKEAIHGQARLKVVAITDNVTTSTGQQWIPITSIPQSSIVNIQNVTLIKIKSDAGVAPVKLKLIAMLPDGTSSEQILELETKPYIKAEVATHVSYDPESRLNEQNQWKFEFRNTSEFTPTQDLQVEIEALGIPQEWISYRQKIGKIEAGTFKPGKISKLLPFYFTFTNKSVVGRTVQMEVTVKYMGSEAMKRIYNVRVVEPCTVFCNDW